MYKVKLTDLYKQIKEQETETEEQKYSIFCDMDGVLTNFLKAVEDLGYGTFEELEKKDNSLDELKKLVGV